MTRTIPIVMPLSNDPVGSGLVKRLGRPGGNITGFSNLSTDLSPKIIELIHAIAPGAVRIAILSNPDNSANAAILDNLRTAMGLVGMTGIVVDATTAQKIDTAFVQMTEQSAQALVVAPDTLFVEQRRQLAERRLKRRLPSICEFREHVEAGALMSYGQNLADGYRRPATFVDKIFKGAKAGDLPIEQSTKLELVINLATARALRVTVPADLLARSDEVIVCSRPLVLTGNFGVRSDRVSCPPYCGRAQEPRNVLMPRRPHPDTLKLLQFGPNRRSA